MTLDEGSLQAKYDLVNLSVITSTQISSRTLAVLAQFSPSGHEIENNDPATIAAAGNNNGRPVIVALTARANATNKLISIVEIAKRELTSKKVKCFQYNALGSEIVEIERKSKSGNDESESDDAFETMGAVPLSEKKKRSMPVMTVYLAITPIRELRLAYGEQT
ncbi:hypothetical protein CLAFUW4_13733 [Fulvia fulva]|uniref:DNA/RNA-binding protein Alba-like domain-containing protein n=1 Tax=Passalora fulva TaxID=5499 RepID=A0A9Q8PKQ2_PASFU|nr:uncharacterized protein CLAFUR5_13581 [Fulvia fulva]KAK4610447.1 hypothetical protein CLAFUR4_13736 [Fulvia fulva]KAK4610992.1 hypothetical protein CLAFUR0_13740 [Fulvia fulva]UJO24169.1 hypothetical protein CLAFUR5_13581 [Fulvia fulva]WPV22160.1 hypothetical protein CLAFUW4_13733 [Fulvia fulva]WPV37290.1 hypothetical protein CLAFUW7_13741 [Fulvia fulva]